MPLPSLSGAGGEHLARPQRNLPLERRVFFRLHGPRGDVEVGTCALPRGWGSSSILTASIRAFQGVAFPPLMFPFTCSHLKLKT